MTAPAREYSARRCVCIACGEGTVTRCGRCGAPVCKAHRVERQLNEHDRVRYRCARHADA